MIGQRISMVNGVAQVSVYGGQKYAVRVQFDPAALASRGIGIDEVDNAINAGNVNLPTGTLWGPNRPYTVQSQRPAANAAAYRPLIVTYRNGSPVRLRGVRQRDDSVENNKTGRLVYGSGRSCSPSSASRAPTRSKWSTTSGGCCQYPQANARLGRT